MTKSLTLDRTTAHPAVATRPPWLDRGLFPFESRYVQVGDHRIHYVDEGRGPTLLLVHGSPAWSFQYRSLIARLRSTYRCVAVDMPGFGLSEPPPGFVLGLESLGRAIESFVKRLDLERITLAVHATGGPAAMGLAVREPDRIERLVIANSFAWPLRHHPSLHLMARFVGSRLFGLAQVHGRLLMRVFAAKGRRVAPFSNAERAALLGPMTLSRRRGMQQLLRSLTREEAYLDELDRTLTRLRHVPALFTFGGHDKGYRAGTLERWQQRLPRHDTLVIDEAGHFLHEDAPDPIAEAIARFMETS